MSLARGKVSPRPLKHQKNPLFIDIFANSGRPTHLSSTHYATSSKVSPGLTFQACLQSWFSLNGCYVRITSETIISTNTMFYDRVCDLSLSPWDSHTGCLNTSKHIYSQKVSILSGMTFFFITYKNSSFLFSGLGYSTVAACDRTTHKSAL